MESRSDYYATLALRLSVPVASFAADLGEGDEQWIVGDVVEAMARRGSVEAAELLSTLERDDDQPGDEMAGTPVVELRSTTGPRVSADAPIDDLLAATWHRPFPKAVINRLRMTRDPVEVDALRRAARDVDNPGWHLALHVLARRADVSPLEVVERVLAADETGSVRASAFRFVTALPSDIALPLARSWLSHDDGRGSAASAVLASHAEPVDALALREALAVATDYYSMSSLVEALGRLPEAGPFPELDEVYVHSAYSYTRARAVHAMAATDPAFADKWAAECLWDCEGVVRAEGARLASLDSVVAARLQELANDEFEVDEVRDEAQARLDGRGA